MENENVNTKEQNPIEEKIEDTQLDNQAEENTNGATGEAIKNEVEENTENTSPKRKNREKGVTFPMSFCGIMIDEAICLGLSYVLEFVINAIMKATLGYVFNNMLEALSLIFIIVQILYVSIMESQFKGQTIGKSLFNLKVIEK